MLAFALQNGHVKGFGAETRSERWDAESTSTAGEPMVRLSPHGRHVACLSLGDPVVQLKLLDCQDGTTSLQYPMHDGSGDCTCTTEDAPPAPCPLFPTLQVLAVEFSPCGKRIASAGDGGEVALWNVQGGGLVWRCASQLKEVSSMSFSCDGALLACAGYEEECHIIDVETATYVRGVPDCKYVAFSPTNRFSLITADRYSTKMWDLAEGEGEAEWTIGAGLENESNFAVFAPDGLMVATVFQPRTASYDSSDDDSWDGEDHGVFVKVVWAATGQIHCLLQHDVEEDRADINHAAFSVPTLNPKP
jgi:WD40 repeat protein